MYFRTLKAFAIIFIIGGCINSLAINANYEECNPDDVEGTMEGTVYGADRDCLKFNGQVAGDIIVVVAFVIFIILVNQYEDDVIRDIDEAQQTTQDYSIWIKDPPQDVTNPQEYYNFFKQFGEVVFITIAKDNGALIEELSERKALTSKLEALKEAGFTKEGQKEKTTWLRYMCTMMGLVQSIEQMESKLEKLEKDIEILAQKDYKPWRVFVTFNREEDQLYCLTKLSFWGGDVLGTDSSLKFKGVQLRVEEAPEPSSVLYTASQYDKTWKYTTWAISFSIAGGLIMSAFYIINSMIQTSPDSVALFVSILNSVLPTFMKMMTTMFEVHDTEDSQQTSILIKLLVTRCLTATVIIYIATPFDEKFAKDKLGASIQVLLFDCFFGPVLRFIDPYTNLLRYVVAPRVSQTQEELNQFFEATQWTLAERYTDIMKTAVVGLFYAVPIPAGLFITAAAMIINYFADKYSLFRIWSRPPMLDGKLAMTARYFFGATLWTHCCISMHYFANWPYQNSEEEADCGVFSCKEKTVMTDSQWEAVQLYSAFNIIVFVILSIWLFQEYIFGLLVALEWVEKPGDEDGPSPTPYRDVTGEFCYIPTIDHPFLIDDVICADVKGIPNTRYPRPAHTVETKFGNLSNTRTHITNDQDVLELCTVYNIKEFKFIQNSKTGDLVLKNVFSTVKYYEPPGFSTRIENLGGKVSLFGTKMIENFGFGSGSHTSTAKPTFAASATSADTPPALPIPGQGSLTETTSKVNSVIDGIARQSAETAHGGAAYGKSALDYARQYASNIAGGKPAQLERDIAAKHAGAAHSSASDGLPEGWEEKTTPEGKKYYVNHKTKKTQWTKPSK
jgi:hypothetical protein